jgi:FkbM family methyltransferase
MPSYIDLVDTGRPEHNWEGHYLLKEGDIFVEAGAFWGRYGRIASRKVGPSGKVILIEASPENQATILDLIKRDGLNNITLIRAAIWSTNGKTNFMKYGNPAGHRIAVEHDSINYPGDVILVDQVTLDEVLPPLVDHVDLLSSDVEGAELEMVKGANVLLSKGFIKNVAIGAYHNPDKPTQIMEILRGYGFKGLRYEEGIVFGHT